MKKYAKEVTEAMELCLFINEGAQRMTLEKFSTALKESIGADRDYAESVYRRFQDNPVAYLSTRNPSDQSLELLNVMFEDAEKLHQS